MTKTLYAYRPIGKTSPLFAYQDSAGAKEITEAWFVRCGYRDREQLDKIFSQWELITLTVEEDE